MSYPELNFFFILHIALILRHHPTTITCSAIPRLTSFTWQDLRFFASRLANRVSLRVFASEPTAGLYLRGVEQVAQMWMNVTKMMEYILKNNGCLHLHILLNIFLVQSARELMDTIF